MSRARDGEKAACTWRNLSGRINSMPRNRRIAARSPGRVLEFGMFGALFLASVLAPAMLASVQPASGQASTIQNIGEALRASNYTADLQLIEPALRESPNDPRLWSMQGMALSGLRRAPEALASYKHALKISPDYLPALEGAAQIEYEADNKNAIPLLQQILRARPDDATSHAMLGTMDYKRGNCRDAVLHFDRSQSVLQSQPLALQQYGSCLAKVDRVDEAVAVFQKLVESNPTDAASRRRLAALQLTARRPKDAMATLQPLLLIDPPDPRVAELACAAYEADGNTPEGVSVPDQRRRRNEIGQGRVNPISLGHDEMAELMRQQNTHQRHREGNAQHQICRVLKEPPQGKRRQHHGIVAKRRQVVQEVVLQARSNRQRCKKGDQQQQNMRSEEYTSELQSLRH